MKDLYKVLGIDRDADENIIKKAYKYIYKSYEWYHPSQRTTINGCGESGAVSVFL